MIYRYPIDPIDYPIIPSLKMKMCGPSNRTFLNYQSYLLLEK